MEITKKSWTQQEEIKKIDYYFHERKFKDLDTSLIDFYRDLRKILPSPFPHSENYSRGFFNKNDFVRNLDNGLPTYLFDICMTDEGLVFLEYEGGYVSRENILKHVNASLKRLNVILCDPPMRNAENNLENLIHDYGFIVNKEMDRIGISKRRY